MKKITILSLLIIVTTTIQAQTFYGSGVYLYADGNAVFDLSNPDLYDGFMLKVKDASGNVVVDLGAILQSEMSDSSVTYTIPWVSPYGYDCSPSTTYSFTYNSDYSVEYYFPSTWQFYYYTHNPYTSIRIQLHLFDVDDVWMGTYDVGGCQYGHTLYVGQYWYCYGLDILGSSNSGFKRISNYYYIRPTWQYEDLFYDDFNGGSGSFIDTIDHVKLVVSFTG
jgi:hypothetical protein